MLLDQCEWFFDYVSFTYDNYICVKPNPIFEEPDVVGQDANVLEVGELCVPKSYVVKVSAWKYFMTKYFFVLCDHMLK